MNIPIKVTALAGLVALSTSLAGCFPFGPHLGHSEREFKNNPDLCAHIDEVTSLDLENPLSPGASTPDTESVGIDTVPYYIEETETINFCMTDDDGDTHKALLKNDKGEIIFTVEADKECVEQTLEPGYYFLEVHHGGQNPEYGSDTIFIHEQASEDKTSFLPRAYAAGFRTNPSTSRTILIESNSCERCYLYSMDLSGNNLAGANLTNADLRTANLENTNFQNAKLNSALLGNANAANANFEGADLSSANLNKTIANDANFNKANLLNTDFTEATTEDATFKEVTAKAAIFAYAQTTRANFQNAFLDSANFSNAVAKQANFQGTSLWQTNFSSTHLERANFKGVDTSNAMWGGAYLFSTIWSNGEVCSDKSVGTCNY